jgi:hypothetical protein
MLLFLVFYIYIYIFNFTQELIGGSKDRPIPFWFMSVPFWAEFKTKNLLIWYGNRLLQNLVVLRNLSSH